MAAGVTYLTVSRSAREMRPLLATPQICRTIWTEIFNLLIFLGVLFMNTPSLPEKTSSSHLPKLLYQVVEKNPTKTLQPQKRAVLYALDQTLFAGCCKMDICHAPCRKKRPGNRARNFCNGLVQSRRPGFHIPGRSLAKPRIYWLSGQIIDL